MAANAVAARTGFIDKVQLICGRNHFTTELVQGAQIVINGAVYPGLILTTLISDGNGDCFFVDIHTNKFYSVHGLPPWFWLCVKGY